MATIQTLFSQRKCVSHQPVSYSVVLAAIVPGVYYSFQQTIHHTTKFYKHNYRRLVESDKTLKRFIVVRDVSDAVIFKETGNTSDVIIVFGINACIYVQIVRAHVYRLSRGVCIYVFSRVIYE